MAEIDVFYDGGCPICRYEVRVYGGMDRAGRIAWIDIEAIDDAELPAGRTRESLLRRFHVRDAAGGWHIGVDAFARIWRELPWLRRLAWAFRTPVLRQLFEIAYRLFLRWQQRDRRRRIARADSAG